MPVQTFNETDLFASEDVDFFAEFIQSFFTLGHSGLELFLGAFSTAGDPGITQLQDRLDVLRPGE